MNPVVSWNQNLTCQKLINLVYHAYIPCYKTSIFLLRIHRDNFTAHIKEHTVQHNETKILENERSNRLTSASALLRQRQVSLNLSRQQLPCSGTPTRDGQRCRTRSMSASSFSLQVQILRPHLPSFRQKQLVVQRLSDCQASLRCRQAQRPVCWGKPRRDDRRCHTRSISASSSKLLNSIHHQLLFPRA